MHDESLITVTDTTFAETVLAARTPVVLDIWARWCPPCGPVARILAELAGEFRGQVLIGSLDADANPRIPRDHRVTSLPTLLFFRDGVVTATIVGARPKSTLRQVLAQHAGQSGAVPPPYVNS